MRGVITSRDVLLHPVAICRAFGPGCWFRCVRAVMSGRACTFLEMIAGR